MHTESTTSLPLASRRQFSTRSLADAREYLSGVFWPHRLTLNYLRGSIQFQHNMVELGSNLSLNALSYNSEISNVGEPSDNSYLVILSLAGTIEVSEAIRPTRTVVAGRDSVLVMNPTRPFRSRLSADHHQLTVKVSGDYLYRRFEREFGFTPQSPLEFEPRACSVGKDVTGFGRVIQLLCNELGCHDSAISRPAVSEHFECTLVSLLLNEFPHNFSQYTTDQHERAVPRYVRVAQAYIRSRATERVTIEEVARHCHVTPRTLQAGFQDHLKTTPNRFLRRVRLELAREALSRQTLTGTRVTEIAMEFGFSSASRFSQYYREYFGCSPSETLRNSDSED